ncbi:polyprenyl synthetase family protein [Pontibacillus salicampi]|uniref:Polyprenyl synthetase family protein n=1 Tax=Pontibacillus salicampi TaxID=1449801 RepID=A0ABV6LRT5_9BACI
MIQEIEHLNHAIADKILQTIQDRWYDADLVEKAQTCIHAKYQEGFSFAVLTRTHFYMFGGEEKDECIEPCAAIECMILALDIFDDLQDQDREDKPWCQMSYPIAMNIATGLLMMSLDILDNTSFPASHKQTAHQYLYHQVIRAVQGQHQDLSESLETEEAYRTMLRNKSGSLMACACLIGTSLATTSKSVHNEVRAYAEDFGIAAQLANDLEDVLRWDNKNDVLYGKKSFPVLLLLRQEGEESHMLRSYYRGELSLSRLLEQKHHLFHWMQHSSALKYVQVVKRLYQRQSLQGLKQTSGLEIWKQQIIHMMESL